MSFMWTSSYRKVFDRFKEPIQINGRQEYALVYKISTSENKTLEEYGIIETSRQEIWLLPETQIEVGDEVLFRDEKYRVVEVVKYLNIAQKAILEKAQV